MKYYLSIIFTCTLLTGCLKQDSATISKSYMCKNADDRVTSTVAILSNSFSIISESNDIIRPYSYSNQVRGNSFKKEFSWKLFSKDKRIKEKTLKINKLFANFKKDISLITYQRISNISVTYVIEEKKESVDVKVIFKYNQ